jgi:hypothetical protein
VTTALIDLPSSGRQCSLNRKRATQKMAQFLLIVEIFKFSLSGT